MLTARPKIRPRRIRVSRDDGTDAFIIRVSDFPENSRSGDDLLAWHEAWFCCWASVPDLLDELGPFDLVVQECAVPVPTEIGWDDECLATLMRTTKEKRGITIGQLVDSVNHDGRSNDCRGRPEPGSKVTM